MLSRSAGAGSSASAQRNPLSIYVTNGIWASRDRHWVGALRGAPRWKGWRKTPALGGCSPGEGFPPKIPPRGVEGFSKSGHRASWTWN